MVGSEEDCAAKLASGSVRGPPVRIYTNQDALEVKTEVDPTQPALVKWIIQFTETSAVGHFPGQPT